MQKRHEDIHKGWKPRPAMPDAVKNPWGPAPQICQNTCGHEMVIRSMRPAPPPPRPVPCPIHILVAVAVVNIDIVVLLSEVKSKDSLALRDVCCFYNCFCLLLLYL